MATASGSNTNVPTDPKEIRTLLERAQARLVGLVAEESLLIQRNFGVFD